MILLLGVSGIIPCHGEESPPAPGGLILEKAMLCEGMTGFSPKNVAIVFPISSGKVVCFTSFSQVPVEMLVYHVWYRKDQLSTKRKLVLKPPQWSAFTEIQLRETDKGPWRVEVVDDNGNVLRVLRFSITD
jgi:hypothetical protein